MAKRIHSTEFKTMIVKLLQSGQSVKQVSSDYDLHESMIRKWRKSYENNLGDFIYRYNFTHYLQAYKIIDNYINWYNNLRLHSSLGYKTPLEVEIEYYNNFRFYCEFSG